MKMLVVGNDKVLRAGIVQYLRLIRPANLVAEAAFGPGLLDVVSAASWDLIALDLQGSGDLTLVERLKQSAPNIPVLVLNDGGTSAAFEAAIAAGASGYLDKGSDAQEWRNAFENVAAGRR